MDILYIQSTAVLSFNLMCLYSFDFIKALNWGKADSTDCPICAVISAALHLAESRPNTLHFSCATQYVFPSG